MNTIFLQEMTANIQRLSRYNEGRVDRVTVQTLLQTVEPIAEGQFWYIPSGASVPPHVLDFLKKDAESKGAQFQLPMIPLKSDILESTEDIQEQALAGNLREVLDDVNKAILVSVMKKTELSKLPGRSKEGHYVYEINYEHNIYEVPNQPNHYEFVTQLPFSGMQLSPSGGRVELVVVMPTGAVVDSNLTKGIDENGLELQEYITQIPGTTKSVVSFEYRLDPTFTVHYSYNE
ncbi:hypothetical protein NLX67_14740 [Domibacillus sp. A3M-37]|uniref:hypothetical protein n=1 Tax=Domibacillus sp. A3M-37 TaxID=2962037 RepID=UPI0020B63AA8|nr:hypothetical protein [Domibacillus sp. A3M-37]MCP3763634.1 hypothetical protein [Domibacillus sp. A3M-37]